MNAWRVVIYACTFVSGGVALIFQVVWQRYLAFLLGSEAKSISLVVAIFLFGLAAGYRYWGNLTERNWSRQKLLKTLGFIELGIAAWGLAFPQIFSLVQQIAYAGPDWLLYDMLVGLMLLFVPTFLMGASIPLLTAAVPIGADEVNYCHSRIYGVNTLGAFFGALAAGFVLVPQFGLLMSLVIGGLLDVAVGAVFIANRLSGPAHKAEDIPVIPNSFGAWGIYLFVFVTGAVSIGLELIFVRLAGLAMGSSQHVFPIVVGLVILGLAIGSLSLRRQGFTAQRVPRELIKLSVLLAAIYFTVPYWPYWLSHVRVSLTSIPSNFAVQLVLSLLFFSVFLLPLMIPMGRLLPAGYSLLEKTRDDYGKLCGRIYFSNTLGTVLGAVGIGYVLFLVLDLPSMFKLMIIMLLALASFLQWRSRRTAAPAVCLLLGIGVLFFPTWNRQAHVNGMFRVSTVQPYHFQGLFNLPRRLPDEGLMMLKDDPNTTVGAVSGPEYYPEIDQYVDAKYITVNGKVDANTIADYSNMVTVGMLAYLYSPRENGIEAAVVGIGTGMTSGALAAAEDVQSVTTLEISTGVIEAVPLFANENFDLAGNPKSKLVHADAFRFFTRNRGTFDVIISEPSNPWVIGVENLFTPEFYRLVSRSLHESGVFCQWIQLYSTDDAIFAGICRNVVEEFPHVSLYAVGGQDMAIVASHQPLNAPHMMRRFAQAHVKRALEPMAIDSSATLAMLELNQTAHVRAIASSSATRRHSVESPWIGHAAARALFLRQQPNLGSTVMREMGRHLPWNDRRHATFLEWMNQRSGDLDQWCQPDRRRHSSAFLYRRLQALVAEFRRIKSAPEPASIALNVEAYGRLRQQGFIPADLNLLEQWTDALLERSSAIAPPGPAGLEQGARALVREFALEWQWGRAAQAVEHFKQAGVLSASDADDEMQEILGYQDRVSDWLELIEQ